MKVVYWCPARQIPTGGVLVIYRHSECLNKLGVDSSIFHWHDPNFSCNWFKHSCNFKKEKTFNPSKEFSIIPEGVSSKFGHQLKKIGAKYGIFVQNSVYTLSGGDKANFESIRKAYLNADLIITISDYTTNFVKYIFSEVNPEKIVQLIPSVTGCSIGKKNKTISIMPRKLTSHAYYIQQIKNYLIPSEWNLISLDNISQEEVFQKLSTSSIFISLSDLEGLGLPPIEAAISGNLVVGYTGEGGKEYFDGPLFKPVNNGDFIAMFDSLKTSIEIVDSGFLNSTSAINAIRSLKEKYSTHSELSSLKILRDKIASLY